MTKSQLLKELEPYDDNIEIDIVVSILNCDCRMTRNRYCYCKYDDENKYIEGISEFTQYNKKTKKQEVTGLSIRGG